MRCSKWWKQAGLHIVREYTGHGVGRQMHEAPQVLNYVGGDADGNLCCEPGVVIAIEPMVQAGDMADADADGSSGRCQQGSLAWPLILSIQLPSRIMGRKF